MVYVLVMSQPSFGAALWGLRHTREALLQPWSTDVTPPKARVSVDPLLVVSSCVPCTGVALHDYCVIKEGSCSGRSVLVSSVIVFTVTVYVLVMTQPSFGAALWGLCHAREALLQPSRSTYLTPPKARVSCGC
jgi:hypothetical protein